MQSDPLHQCLIDVFVINNECEFFEFYFFFRWMQTMRLDDLNHAVLIKLTGTTQLGEWTKNGTKWLHLHFDEKFTIESVEMLLHTHNMMAVIKSKTVDCQKEKKKKLFFWIERNQYDGLKQKFKS